MTIGELVMLLKIDVKANGLDTLGKTLDDLTKKAQGLASALTGIKGPSGGGGGSASSTTTSPAVQAAQRTAQAAGQQANNHVAMFNWQKAQAAKKQQDNEKAASAKKTAAHQQYLWFRRLTEVSGKIASGLAGFQATLFGLAELGRQSAVGLTKFGLNTGISPEVLQRFQLAGVKSDISGEQMQGAFQALAKVKRDASWGVADFGAISALNLDTNASVPEMLLALQKKGSAFSRMTPQDQVAFLGRLGLGPEIQQGLARGRLGTDVGNVDPNLVLGPDGAARIMRMDEAWQTMTADLKALGVQLGDLMSRYFAPLWQSLDTGIHIAADWAKWLNGESTTAEILRDTLYGVAAALGAVGVAMTALTATAGIAGLISMIGILSGGGAGLAALAGGSGGSALTVALSGFAAASELLVPALLGIGTVLLGGAALGAGYGLGKVLGADEAGVALGDFVSDAWGDLTGQSNDIGGSRTADRLRSAGIGHSTFSGTGAITHNNSLAVTVNGGDPKEVKATLDDWWKSTLRTAAVNSPQFAPP